jgi:hypothetical protein
MAQSIGCAIVYRNTCPKKGRAFYLLLVLQLSA